MKRLFTAAIFFSIFVLVFIVYGSSALSKPLALEFQKDKEGDVSQLTSAKEVFSQLKTQAINALPEKTKVINFTLDSSQGKYYQGSSQGYDDVLTIEGLKTGTYPGQPALPVKTFRITLDKNTVVRSVKVVAGKYREILTPLGIRPVPEPVTWSDADKDQTVTKGDVVKTIK